MPRWVKVPKFQKGQYVKFFQYHMDRTLPFIGKIHDITQIGENLVLHVEVLHSDGTLWALVQENAALLYEGVECQDGGMKEPNKPCLQKPGVRRSKRTARTASSKSGQLH